MVMPIASASSVRVIPLSLSSRPGAPRCCNQLRRASLRPWLRRLRVTGRRSGKPLPGPEYRTRRGWRPKRRRGILSPCRAAAPGCARLRRTNWGRSPRRHRQRIAEQQENADPAQASSVCFLKRVSPLYRGGHPLDQPEAGDKKHESRSIGAYQQKKLGQRRVGHRDADWESTSYFPPGREGCRRFRVHRNVHRQPKVPIGRLHAAKDQPHYPAQDHQHDGNGRNEPCSPSAPKPHVASISTPYRKTILSNNDNNDFR